MLFNTQLKFSPTPAPLLSVFVSRIAKIVSECQFWKFWAHECERISTAIWNKGVSFQHHLQNLVAFATTCKRAILWIYGHVFPVVILILGSLPHCVSSDLYWTLNALGKAQGVGLHWNKGLGGRPEGGAQIWKSFAPDTITWCKNFTRFFYKISCDTQWVEGHAILF